MSRYKAYPEYKDSGVEWVTTVPRLENDAGEIHLCYSEVTIYQAMKWLKVIFSFWIRMP
jgi:hypothetical protein